MMIVRDMTTSPIEKEKTRIDKNSVQRIYQTGYSTITVRSIFDPKHSYADVLCRIIKRKMNLTGTM